ncbi:hypothetical protein PHLCEN_2v68 [Hermanssonia centrifuga]|uniref:F-box domain-containing protein n=1 Tax=Hermanssonia centrifuga TaxID=98765 RepID=A0A2R6S718_9APHY|nr:hypothetical protein PHLCEN_2v68 [Hermanssonia centrifuga]
MSTSTLVSVPSVTATGANVPEDLFERVLVFLDEEVTSAWHWDNEREKRKRELGRCSLTCRYWARRCQPRIFEHIRLPSKYCLDQLLSLLESPLSHVSDYIKHLYLIQHTSDSKSWIHLVPLQLVPKLSLNPTINLDFQGGWGEAYNKRSGHLRSIYYTLHSARPEFSSHISDINLYNLQFRSFADLAHLVGELRSLQTLQCRRVGWSSPVPENYIIPVCPPSLNRVKMYECTENAAGVLFLIGRQRRMPQNEALPVFRLDRNQQLLATRLIQNLVHVPSDGSAQAVFECTIEKVDGVYRE